MSLWSLAWRLLIGISGILVGFFGPLMLSMVLALLLFAFIFNFSVERDNLLKLCTEAVFAAAVAAAVFSSPLRASPVGFSFFIGVLISSATLTIASFAVWSGFI